MRCPNCSNKHKRSEGQTCACGYTFTFNKQIDGITDGRFLAAAKAASALDTYYFTMNQFYTAFCRRMQQGLHPRAMLIIGLVLIGVGFIFLPAAFIGAVILIVAVYLFFKGPPPRRKLENYVAKWRRSGKELDRLIEQPRLHQPPPEWREPDIYDYGVEKILIVERDLLVDWFVLNGFHAEQRMLVLSESGYPDYLVPIARQLLRDHPELPVYILHDATEQGRKMVSRLKISQRLPVGDREIHDLGLHKEDVRRMKRLKPIAPRKNDYEVPVDALSYALLAPAVATAMISGMTLHDLIMMPATQRDRGDGGGSSSFG